MKCCVRSTNDWTTWIGAIFILLFGALDYVVEDKTETVSDAVQQVVDTQPDEADESESDEEPKPAPAEDDRS